MNLRHFGRAQQMWVLVAACFVMFGLFLLLVPGMTLAMWWPSMVAALVASAITIAAFQWWLGNVLGRRDSSIQLLNRITAGDLQRQGRKTVTARLHAGQIERFDNADAATRKGVMILQHLGVNRIDRRQIQADQFNAARL